MKTIEINTTQNVTIQYELANLRDRGVALFIDLIVLYAFLGLSQLIVTLFAPFDTDMYYILNLIFVAPLFVGYALIWEIFFHGQTMGKKAVGIKVVKMNGKLPTLSDYFLRWTFRLIDIYFSFFSMGSILISSSEKSQRLGDILAGTVVIRMKPNMTIKLNDILKIHSVQSYQPKYPEVTRLSEDDMLLVKSMVLRFRTYSNPAHKKALNEMVLKLKDQLSIREEHKDNIEFLNTLINDYVVLTR